MNMSDEYSVENGVIVTPGKFEGEHAYMPLAYDTYLNGEGEEQDDGSVIVEFMWEGDWRKARFKEDDNGFIFEMAMRGKR
jgi:hypothetical protein